MPIYCISDCHLCDKGPRDDFIVRGEARLHNFLDYVEQNKGTLYVLGDLFDWWQCNLSASVLAYRDLLARLTFVGPYGLGATWVPGNHDSALTQFIETEIGFKGIDRPAMRLPFEATIGGRRFAFLHGHEADTYCSSLNPGVGEITAILTALAKDKNNGPNYKRHPVEDVLISAMEAPLNLWRHAIGLPDRRNEMLDNVEKYRAEKKADVVVYGHTHEPGYIGNYHYNAGCWCRDRDTFVCIEDNGQVTINEWLGDHAQLFMEQLR